MIDKLGEKDRVSIAVYAGAAGQILSPTPGSQKQTIISALERLQAGGSTAGGAGIELAYKLASQNFIKGGNNRVILATDGDFNVGVSSNGALVRMIEKKRESGVYLSILGFGMGNYKDSRMEQLANKGNGNYAYIDSIREAKKVLVHDLRGTLFTIAKDVKIQIEFNPANVHSYRLIGYENRMLKKEDFNNDKKDAGELGAGHTVTALYEVVSPQEAIKLSSVDALKYQQTNQDKGAQGKTDSFSDELATVKLRYKLPDESSSRLISVSVSAQPKELAETSSNFKFASAVAQFGMILRDSEFKGSASYDSTLNLANSALSKDPHGYRQEFIQLVETAKLLD
jgi:Ca-activated chloride channel family protein